MAFSVSEAINSVANALGSVAGAISNYFGGTSSSDPYNYDDQPYLTGDGRSTVYDVAPPEAVLRNGPLELGGYAHMSERNGALDGYVKTLQSNNIADNNTAAKHAYYFVDTDGGAPGAVDVNMTGSTKANLMIGTGGENVIRGMDGNDVLVGRDGNDVLDGGNGSDKITGGRGNDRATGGAGADEFHMGGGNDIVTAAGDDEIWTGAGYDTIRAGNVRLEIRNFNPNYDRLDLVDANEGHYRATNVGGFVIEKFDNQWSIGVGVNADDGHFTLRHDSNGFEAQVSTADSRWFVDTYAEAVQVKSNPFAYADGWFDII